MIRALLTQARTAALTATVATCAVFSSAAQAGAVSTSFDPLFGSALPDLSYSGSIAFNIADSCLGPAGTGTRHITLSGACKTQANATLRLFDADVANDSKVTSFGLKVNGLTLLNDLVVGWDTNSEVFSNSAFVNFAAKLLGANVYKSNPYKSVAAAGNNDFSFKYAAGVPQLTCLYCNGKPLDFVLGGYAGKDGQPGFSQDISYTNDKGANTRITMTLNGSTPQYAVEVPEPASMALVLGALGVLGAVRNRQQRSSRAA
ncbi:PEP-CTERM sorting domain-containing protein [Paucibacter sp. AS339]|uniref:PEP-CTERM sorting domain-containing protein n=1 Tax=Paucibacter hankyongi TaxID=3133434 RepID=UPI00309AB7AF